jgi:fructoselysine-6-P-deglycase FrlB-like protein
MVNIELLVENAKKSLLFTAPVLESDLGRFLEKQAKNIKVLAQDSLRSGIDQVYWIGSGNSWCNLYSGSYLLDRFTTLPSEYHTGYELIWRNPKRLGKNALVFFASFSGATEDTLAALNFAKSKGATTVAIVNKADSPMGEIADYTIPFESKALYILPLAAAYLFSLEVARLDGDKEVEKIMAGLMSLPPVLGQLYRDEEAGAKKLAETFATEELFYTLGSGPLYGLAYKFGLTVFMENMRVHGSFIETSEFRQGPIEMLEHKRPVIVILLGTDESRSTGERVRDMVRTAGARTITFDMAEYPDVHPLLAPFVLMVPLQWFAVYSTLLRGITDLDDRVYMGRGILSKGEGVTWP